MNRLSTVVDNRLPAGQNTTTYSYDPVSNLATVAYANGVQYAFTYDVLDRLTGKSLSKASTLASYNYQRGAAGHIASVTEQSGRSASFAYDAAYRLVSETIAGDSGGKNGTIGYTLDPAGNRLTRTSSVTGIGAQSFTFDANDQIAGETYDQNGNTLSTSGSTFAYDFLNRLKWANGGAVTLVYDGVDNRVAKTVGGTTTQYLIDDLNPTGYAQVVEEISGGTVQATYAYGLVRISQTRWAGGMGTPSFYGYDGQDHVRLLTNAAGVVTDTYDYDAFGNPIAVSGTTVNVYRYRGEQWDSDLGLYYLRARYYNAGTGRFLTRDPLDASIGDVVNQHRYLYAGVDPVNRVDPSGMLADPPGAPGTRLVQLAVVLGVSVLALDQFGAIWEFQYQLQHAAPQPPVGVNPIAWNAKCIGNLTDSLLRAAADSEFGVARRVACHEEIRDRVIVNRGVNSNSPSAIRYDPDGVSVFEELTGTNKCVVSFEVEYDAPKIPGRTGTVVSMFSEDMPGPIPILGVSARYDGYDVPSIGLRHWGLDSDALKPILSSGILKQLCPNKRMK